MNTMIYEDEKEKKMDYKYEPKMLSLKAYNYDLWLENEESTNKKDLTDKEESVNLWHATTRRWWRRKRWKGLKILTPNKHTIN